ncbi:unnamed protein product [Didymodactylos carnosus]|uniref:Uncharacterized protein n=1 Tax=Didymodactylos carnosus TaxID=1234261 RepID=A0A815CL33_9BILA|nr:unnamed protein product [Didymodactylos carnosus]CAF4092579.1 unnamed protein product [Didymodactylos carnosus]CAF4353886.1 unnamed protein product [Didymodactylos carnosus]
MSTTPVLPDILQLPQDIFNLKDHQFYDYVKDTYGLGQAELLSFQRIFCAKVLLATEDPCEIFNIDMQDVQLDILRQQMCFKLSSGDYLVKSGIINSLRLFKEQLKIKDKEQKEQLKRRKTSPTTSSSVPTNATPLTSQALTATTSLPLPLTANQQKKSILNSIKQWCQDNEANLGIDNLKLVDGIDFTLNVSR